MDNKLKIINYLGKRPEIQFTMHELSKLTKIPYATFHRNVHEMNNLLTMIQIGKSKVIKINKNNKSLKSYLSISSEEEKSEFLKRNQIIAKILSEVDSDDVVILFGSYAKGIQKESSDIDLLIINKKGNKTMNFSKYETIFNKTINPIFITPEEFKLMLREREENVGKQALHNHIILNNAEDFWRIALNV